MADEIEGNQNANVGDENVTAHEAETQPDAPWQPDPEYDQLSKASMAASKVAGETGVPIFVGSDEGDCSPKSDSEAHPF